MSLCVYVSLFTLPLISLDRIAQTYGRGAPRITIGAVFLVIAIQTATSYVRDDVAAIVAGRVPQDIIDSNQA